MPEGDGGGVDFQFESDEDGDDAAAFEATMMAAAEPPVPAPSPSGGLSLEDIVRAPPGATAPAPAAFAAGAAGADPLADTGDLDFEFLQTLSNTRKQRKRGGAGRGGAEEFLGEHEELDLEREDAITEKQQIERIHRLRREAQAAAEEDERQAPIRFGDDAETEPEPAPESEPDRPSRGSRRGKGREDDDGDDGESAAAAAMAALSSVSTGNGRKSRRRRETKADRRQSEEVDDGDGEDEEEKPRPKTKAELWQEERSYKAKCVARLEQLEAKGVSCSLPENIDWMSLPLAQLDDELQLMETKNQRKAKILKMRFAFYTLNKALAWGLTEHPGPDFLKFPRVKGLEKTISAEIDEFDDPMERLWDLWFGEGGEIHPLIEIAMLEAVIIGNHVMKGDQGASVKVEGVKTKVDGSRETSSGAASPMSMLANLSAFLNQNPNMAPAVSDVLQQQQQMPAPMPPPPPPPAQDQARQRPKFADFGMPPSVTVPTPPTHSNDFIAQSRSFVQDWKAQSAAEDLRTMLDRVVDRHSQRQQGTLVEEVHDEAEEETPVSVEVTNGGRGRK